MKIYHIAINEPWSSKLQNGDNIIHGHIVKVINEQTLIYQSDINVKFGKSGGNMFLIEPVQLKKFNFSDLSTKRYVPVNVYLVKTYSDIIDEQQLTIEAKFVFSGGLIEI